MRWASGTRRWAHSCARPITPIVRPRKSSPADRRRCGAAAAFTSVATGDAHRVAYHRVFHPESPMRRSPSLATRCVAAFVAAVLLVAPVLARAEASFVRISYGFGILYLPLMVMDREHLLERHAKAAGLSDVKVEWKTFDGGNVINDAMLSGALDIAGIGVPGFLTLWAKAKDNPR